MEYEKAKEIIGKFKEAITSLEWEAGSYRSTKERCQKLEDKNKELKAEINDTKRFERYFNLLASHSKIQICHHCDGLGGFTWDMGEQGAGGEECSACRGTGILEKEIENL